MSSNKWAPWDFVRSFPETIDAHAPGFWAISTFDSFMERIVVKRLPKQKLDGELTTVIGPEISADWLEATFQTQDLFSSGNSYLILQSEDMEKKAQEKLVELAQAGSLDGRHAILLFTQENKFFEKLGKFKEISVRRMEPPRHWEGGKFMQFLCEEMRIKLSPEIQNLLLELLPLSSGELVSALNLLRLQAGSSDPLTSEKVKELISSTKLDQFQLARDFSRHDFQKFADNLFSLGAEHDHFHRFFGFMQSHLIKLADTSYIQKKSRPTKYDKQIQQDQKLWSREELEAYMRMFSAWEVEAKRKSPQMRNLIRGFYYHHLS